MTKNFEGLSSCRKYNGYIVEKIIAVEKNEYH